jgi:quinol monooxygenase YgiN
VLVVARLRPPADEESFRSDVRRAIDAMATRPGHVRTSLARALDDPAMWVLVSEWVNVGSYRRALGNVDVRTASGVLMGAAVNEPSAYDEIETVTTPIE